MHLKDRGLVIISHVIKTPMNVTWGVFYEQILAGSAYDFGIDK